MIHRFHNRFSQLRRLIVCSTTLDPMFIVHLAETLPHDVDVVDVEEDELRVLVVVLALIAAALRHVRHRVHLRPGVVNVDPGDNQSEY